METDITSSISNDRKTFGYRLLEGLIGYSSIGLLVILIVLSFINPAAASVFLIAYSFLWLLKFTINGFYIIYSYKQARRWEEIDWPLLFRLINTDLNKAKEYLTKFKTKYDTKIGWSAKIDHDIESLEQTSSSKFKNPAKIYNVNIFSVYNESAEILIKSLKYISQSEYDLSKILVVVSQEARNGQENNLQIRQAISEETWIQSYNHSETNLDIVYNNAHYNLEYTNQEFADISLGKDNLTVIFTQHPDGLIGEIKGKASNEDWGSRQASLFVKSHPEIDPDLVLVTSLDADSHVCKYFYHNLSYRFCLTQDRLQCGFQPVHVYSNEFFEAGIWPRQIATSNTLSNMMNIGIEGETELFAIYSLPLVAVQKADFWVREVIAEDFMMYAKCLVCFQGNFRVVSHYGVFEGDPVQADDYFESIANQYKQLQRWAWGGVESFPYIFKKFFIDKVGKSIDLRIRLRQTFLLFIKHFTWSTSPLIFSIGIAAPEVISKYINPNYHESPISVNLSIFAQAFAWTSLISLPIFAYITFQYISYRALKDRPPGLKEKFMILLQFLIFPFLFITLGIPALDSQIRGILGKYLGYWVTPKK